MVKTNLRAVTPMRLVSVFALTLMAQTCEAVKLKEYSYTNESGSVTTITNFGIIGIVLGGVFAVCAIAYCTYFIYKCVSGSYAEFEDADDEAEGEKSP